LLVVTLAALAHLLTILLVPRYARHDVASELLATGGDNRAEFLPDNGRRVLDFDPGTAVATCGFDLADGPLRIRARIGHLPFAVSIHQRGGGVLYAVTDRAAQRGAIDFVLMTREQFEERVARDDEGEGEREMRVVSPAVQGIVAARVLVRLPSDRLVADALAAGMACGAAT
jgi:uncharacterized membrane protein